MAAANLVLQRRGFSSASAAAGKRLLFLQIKNPIMSFLSRNPMATSSASRRQFTVSLYDKNVDDGLRPNSVPDDHVIDPQDIDKFWAPHPQTGVFGPTEAIGGGNHAQPPPPNAYTDADAADGSVLDQKARYRPLEDVEKLDVDKPIISTLE